MTTTKLNQLLCITQLIVLSTWSIPSVAAVSVDDGRAFDRGAAIAALTTAAHVAEGCKQPDAPKGVATVKVVFAPSGHVTSADVENPPFAGTPTGGCIAAAFRSADVPPFDGHPVIMTKRVTIR